MKKNIVVSTLLFMLFSAAFGKSYYSTQQWPDNLPVYDHVVIVMLENKDYHEIIGNSNAPYINDVLKKEGANFTQMYGEEHYSQGNYYWLLSGSQQYLQYNDEVPNKQNNPIYPFRTSNIATALIDKGHSFKGYCQSLPEIGFMGVTSKDKLYARKHNPWSSFANIPNGKTVETSSNLRWKDFPAKGDYDKLPTLAIVIPDLDHDMHNGPVNIGVPRGDKWLKDNIDSYYQWAKKNNSLLIITFDENNDKRGYTGLTNPGVNDKDRKLCRDPEFARDLQNRTVTIFAGANIKPGDYKENNGITHVNILRTLEAMYSLPKSGEQQENARVKGIGEDIITDIFIPIGE